VKSGSAPTRIVDAFNGAEDIFAPAPARPVCLANPAVEAGSLTYNHGLSFHPLLEES